MTTNSSKTLTAGQTVIATKKMRWAAEVNTARNYRMADETPEQAHARVLSKGWDTAWANGEASVLDGDRASGARNIARMEARKAAAVAVEHGETVSIEGDTFRVVVHGDGITPAIEFRRV